MKLAVGERYVLLDILPKEGSYTTLKIVRKLREALSFSEEDVKAFKLEEIPLGDGKINIRWDLTAPDAEIAIGEKATDIIVRALQELDKQGTLTDREFSLYAKFIEPAAI